MKKAARFTERLWVKGGQLLCAYWPGDEYSPANPREPTQCRGNSHPNYFKCFIKLTELRVITFDMNIKFSKELKKEICELYSSGQSSIKLSKDYGICVTSILRFLKDDGISCREYNGASRVFHVRDDFFSNPSSWNGDQYWLFGFILTDGCVRKKFGTVSIRISCVDEEILHRISKIIQYTGKIHSEKHTMRRLSWTSHKMCDDLEILKCEENKTFKVDFPDWIPNSMIGHFLRGVIDGDGCLSVNKSNTEVTIIGNRPFMIGVQKRLKELFGFTLSENISKKWDERILCVKTTKQQSVTDIIDLIYPEDAGLFLDRKIKTAKKIVRQYLDSPRCRADKVQLNRLSDRLYRLGLKTAHPSCSLPPVFSAAEVPVLD